MITQLILFIKIGVCWRGLAIHFTVNSITVLFGNSLSYYAWCKKINNSMEENLDFR